MQKNKNPITDIQAQPISLHASYVVLVLFAATLVLNTVSFVIGYAAVSTGDYARYASLGRLFYVGIEKNIPTYFSGAILFSAFVLLTFIAVVEIQRKTSWRCHWGMLAVGFLVMTIDELLSFHERLSSIVRPLLKGETYGVFFFSWVVVAIPVVLFLALFFVRFWWKLPQKSKITFLFAAIVYLSGCLGFEMIEGYYAEKYGINTTYIIVEAMEEGLEMFGIIIFIWGLLNHIEKHCQVELRAFFKFTKKWAQSLSFVSK